MIYSHEMPVYEGKLSMSIQEAIEEIQFFFHLEEVRVLQYDQFSIGIPVIFEVNLPPLGPVRGIDIRNQEPCLIKISLKNYPEECPVVISDRRDFPRSFLGHLYVTGDTSKPGGFCLVRNDPHEWFANKRITDLMVVAKHWLFKAGAGLLNEDGDEFDPIRLEYYTGYHIYKYDTLHTVVSENQRFLPDYSFALLLSSVFVNEHLTYKSLGPVQYLQLENTRKVINKVNSESKEGNQNTLLLSLLVWRIDGLIESEYSLILPRNYGELKIYFQAHGIDIDQIISIYMKSGLQFRNGIPIVHAIRRPKKMVGYDGEFEFVNFVIYASEFKENDYPDEAEVKNQMHIEPFSRELAVKMTGEQRDAKTLYIGCGSLGSKMFIHDSRTGKLDVGGIDQDDFLQHNLVRHTLFNSHVGMKKSDALRNESINFLPLNQTEGFRSYPFRIHRLEEEELKKYNWFVDTTASDVVQNWIVQKIFCHGLNIARCEIVDRGRLGLLYIEGSSRNPRMDDLVNLTYYLGIRNSHLQTWRKNDNESEILNLSVGLGCSSPTTVIADDTISFHASIFSKLLYLEQNRKIIGHNGFLFRSIIDTSGIPIVNSETEIIHPFDIFKCQAGSSWELRLAPGLKEEFLRLCEKKGEIETGGVLIGVANYKTKTIHGFEIIVEPQDSRGTCTGFTRGIKGLPEQVDQVKKKTGQVIGYISEWHTHPMNLEGLSVQDSATIQELRNINRKVPIPTCGIIITKTKILPFIFE